MFLDTNIFIYALENTGPLGVKAQELFLEIKSHKLHAFTSVLTVHEILTGTFKRNLEEKTPLYLQFLSGGGLIKIFDISTETAILSAKIRAQYGFKTPDCIQLAVATEHHAKVFLTHDRHLGTKVGEMVIKSL